MERTRKAFTLIELLIVVAIIAILAAIAVPNFLEAQVRSKVSRVKADMRSLATALQAYATDYNDYPDTPNGGNMTYIQFIPMLSTPVAYITSTEIRDPFTPPPSVHAASNPDWHATYWYASYNGVWRSDLTRQMGRKGYIISCYGPDRVQDTIEFYPYWKAFPNSGPYNNGDGRTYPAPCDLLYDPTNGTKSWGNIGRCGGDLGCEEQLGG
ncbi:MAG TPA: prepilin-type N-terminal cleavage/methylation domain-containing protein [Sumerlaeia bacterium]|nr:prepilin-type N-terminal cleavage/methylation domain-containing protein [Sumerlaeia bacterium]